MWFREISHLKLPLLSMFVFFIFGDSCLFKIRDGFVSANIIIAFCRASPSLPSAKKPFYTSSRRKDGPEQY